MKTLIVLFAVLYVTLADVSELVLNSLVGGGRPRPQNFPHAEAESRILNQEQDIHPDGTYHYNFDTENGIHGDEQGSPQGAQGSFSYSSPEGENIHVSYVADENGFQPQGSHLPTPPPIPDAILRALEWIRTHPEPENRRPF